MKKKVAITVVCLTSMIYAGCGVSSENVKQTTANEENITSDDYQSIRPDEEDVIISATGVLDTTSTYGSIDALMADADAVVYAEAATYSYSVNNGSVSTVICARVLDSLYGDLQTGDEFYVTRMGGYVSLKDYFASYEEQYRDQVRNSTAFADLSDEDIETKYISFFPEGEVDTQSGDRSVFFLYEDENAPDNSPSYYRVGTYEGEYVELSTGDFKVPGFETYEEVDNAVLSDSLDSAGMSSCVISWNEIVDQLEN